MTLQSIKELGNALLGSLISLNVPAYPEEEVPCPCGQTATYQRMRPAHVDTLRAEPPRAEASGRGLGAKPCWELSP